MPECIAGTRQKCMKKAGFFYSQQQRFQKYKYPNLHHFCKSKLIITDNLRTKNFFDFAMSCPAHFILICRVTHGCRKNIYAVLHVLTVRCVYVAVTIPVSFAMCDFLLLLATIHADMLPIPWRPCGPCKPCDPLKPRGPICLLTFFN